MDKKKINLAAHLKKVQLLNPLKSLANQGGFKCEACQATFKNYDIFLDHQNSKVHLTNIGYDKSKAAPSTTAQTVKDKLEALKNRKIAASAPKLSPEEALEKRLEMAQKTEDEERRARYDKKKQARKNKSSS